MPWTDFTNEVLVTGAPFEVAPSLLATVIGAPVIEEILFRGVVYGSLRGRMPALPAALLSALLFALSHAYSPMSTIHIFLGATVWALVYEWTRSLLPGLIDHGLNNTFAAAGDLVLR